MRRFLHGTTMHAAVRRSGFTLIELLVVVGIIALLLAILLPSLSRARLQARSAACKSNLHQIAVWGMEYGQQNDDILPTHGDPATASWPEYGLVAGGTTYLDWYDKARTIVSSSGQVLWQGIYQKQTSGFNPNNNNRSVFLCPEAAVVPLRPSPRQCNYAINEYLGGARSVGSGVNATPIPIPRYNMLRGDIFWFADARAFDSNGAWDFHPILNLNETADPSPKPASAGGTYIGPWNWENSECPYFTSGHPNMTNNFVFGDGHAEGLTESAWKEFDVAHRRAFVGDPRYITY